MNITKFTIQYFRGFKEIQELTLGIPEEGKIGSGLTYLVGENNSGKTTLIEGLYQHQNEKIRESERQDGGSPEFILYEGDRIVRKVSLLRPGSATLVESPILGLEYTFDIIASRRHWASDVNSQNVNMNNVWSDARLSAPRNISVNSQMSGMMASVFAGIEQNEGKYRSFLKEVKRVLPDFASFNVGFENSDYIQYVTSDNVKHRSEMLGDGVISVLRILAHLNDNMTSKPLIIDEPELSLHPLAQRRLFEVLADYSQRRQIIISTHSPYFLSWEALKNGARLNRVVKSHDATCKVFTLRHYSEYSSMVNGANWQMPFLMDDVAKEVFFGENILFVEGQEDVGLLVQDKALNDAISLFGYGVRGYDNFPIAFKFARDIGIKKAAVLIDGGEGETIVANMLRRDYPEYEVIQWNREDIRNKPAYTATEKVGYFDKNGRKKVADLGDYDEKIRSLNAYFLN